MKYTKKDLSKNKIEVIVNFKKEDIDPVYNQIVEEKK